ncbi:F-box protein-like protein [Salvia divinorum]|uniref:F-box protein-like protein n=1 Tax=Salvia divinorum TaxID=28513 RepID=A0ABD1FQF2_SALDI
MDQNFFVNLPSELTSDILSRLPLRSISIGKCVCKSWLNLFQSDDFVKSKIKTPPSLVRLIPMETNSTQCTTFEFEDEDEADVESHALRFQPLTDFEIPLGNPFSKCKAQPANGLLLIHSSLERHIYVCNPITREYIDLCCPVECVSPYMLSFGFGASKISGQYKVFCIDSDTLSDSQHVYTLGSDCHYVYTLGTGTWRRLDLDPASGCSLLFHGSIVCNGNLHWTLYDSAQIFWICALDLETECFSTFSPPAVDELAGDGLAIDVKVNVLRDCLCLSYTLDDKVVIWLMKEYRFQESWTMEYQISIDIDCGFDFSPWDLMNVYPIKVFENGDVLILLKGKCLIYYSNKTRTIRQAGMLTDGTSKNDGASAMIYTPSLYSLKNFGVENVISF